MPVLHKYRPLAVTIFQNRKPDRMDYQLEEVNISNKLKELDIELPSTIAFYPENLKLATKKDELIFTETAAELCKYFKEQNINTEFFGADTELYRSRKSAEIYLPAIFISLSLVSENPSIVSVALNVLSNYITEFFKGTFGKKTVNIEFFIETRKKNVVKKVAYKGDVQGLSELEKVIKSLK